MSEKKTKTSVAPGDKIIVKGARTHNLKNITVEMPRNKMIVFTGLSGSGKSSLAFDTIFAEGQRRYVESLSSYARQFLRQMQKPDVDEIIGLSPAISIDQKSRSNNPRSTVATITEIYDYLRILYARVGHPHCLVCGTEIKKLSNEEIKNFVLEKVAKSSADVEIWSPIVRGRKGEYYQLLYDLLGKGYTTVMVDGKKKSLRERIELTKTKKHEISVLVDFINPKEFKFDEKSSGERLSEAIEKAIHESDGLLVLRLGSEEHLLSAKWACPKDGFSFPEIEPRLFSFNSPYGACPTCNGLGTKYLFGSEPCEDCGGARLRKEALHVLIGGKNILELTKMSIKDCDEFFKKLKLTVREKNISKVVTKEIEARLSFMLNVGIEYLSLDRRAHTLSGGEAQRIRLASQLGSGLVGALYVLDEPTIGLHARDNERLIKTLINLRDLGNTILIVEHDEETIYSSDYIVDIGPGAGVHGGEVVVSGDLDELLTSPKNKSGSLTLSYLRGEEKIEKPEKRRESERGVIRIRGGKIFNIKHLNVDVPLHRLIAVTGVSGSGKSSFVYEILHKNLEVRLDRRYRNANTYNCQSFEGSEYLGRSILIDQSPIGRTPRSNPATYTGAFTFIRELFAESAEARARGWKANRFSFNVKGGRCETCQGNGMIEVEMHFLPTVYVPCDVCGGKRFMKETLEVKYKGKNIFQVLEMTVEEALKFFEDIPAIYDRLKSMNDVGLGYLALGQSATTLSGGEAQRVKIASELYRPHLEKTIYLLDEPTIGLHYADVKKLIEILQKLVDKGNTVIVIEHNLDFIKSADYILDIGPEGGDGGGELVAEGTPEEVANTDTYTGKYLRKALRKK
ncbi:MAG: excinuclease ABC subunit A [Candidatus Zambryskibacteria bacterium RIFCSPLOWO2_02_FULL_51_21]|uniref:UvrABC system protein A n=1 Tax=Candidatus Zambryskibacteria bacterium RIFCSPHIGHO2_02_FULL_43_37 TaxID=1802749 RepID=A0A1G2TGT9_9BACT|nr:MAG: excinuclease ABC subunit A [Candidatus Zambryskibacteria bacterium RIFCSPHIGHO2_01_FULL_52_18]OHA96516.1 MAG: excinuclease ABC subunit A [Candidatus Zambryskibacteria bacterium RIFCSPHIGHO2_02_FULL_43_37]OHB11220.1 MAG: excinuclease ABC subunit A [Candidatus Zambryskibacteria bacterium RIFCSPLOWO2_02_FULL_51_21]